MATDPGPSARSWTAWDAGDAHLPAAPALTTIPPAMAGVLAGVLVSLLAALVAAVCVWHRRNKPRAQTDVESTPPVASAAAGPTHIQVAVDPGLGDLVDDGPGDRLGELPSHGILSSTASSGTPSGHASMVYSQVRASRCQAAHGSIASAMRPTRHFVACMRPRGLALQEGASACHTGPPVWQAPCSSAPLHALLSG